MACPAPGEQEARGKQVPQQSEPHRAHQHQPEGCSLTSGLMREGGALGAFSRWGGAISPLQSRVTPHSTHTAYLAVYFYSPGPSPGLLWQELFSRGLSPPTVRQEFSKVALGPHAEKTPTKLTNTCAPAFSSQPAPCNMPFARAHPKQCRLPQASSPDTLESLHHSKVTPAPGRGEDTHTYHFF